MSKVIEWKDKIMFRVMNGTLLLAPAAVNYISNLQNTKDLEKYVKICSSFLRGAGLKVEAKSCEDLLIVEMVTEPIEIKVEKEVAPALKSAPSIKNKIDKSETKTDV